MMSFTQHVDGCAVCGCFLSASNCPRLCPDAERRFALLWDLVGEYRNQKFLTAAPQVAEHDEQVVDNVRASLGGITS